MDEAVWPLAHTVPLLKVAEAMAGRRRRKVLPLQGFLAHLAAAFVALLCVGAVGFGLWKAWPPVRRQWCAWTASVFSSKDKTETGERSRQSANGSPADSVSHLKKENETLRENDRRLREQLQRTSETLAQKTAEVEELRLRHLILDKTRTGQP